MHQLIDIRIELTLTMPKEPAVYLRKEKFSGDQAATLVNWFDIDYDIAPHGHDFFEIALATGGIGAHLSSKGMQPLNKGNLIIIRPGAWHGYAHCNNLIIHNCCFDQQILQRELSWLRDDVLMNFLLWTGPYMGERRGVLILSLQDNCLEECLAHWNALSQVQDGSRRTETIGRLLILLESLARSVESLDHLKQQARPIHPAVMESIRLLESEIEQPWSLRNLAEKIHLNPSYLVRLFKEEVGLTPIAYLNHCRLERSAGLLHTPLAVSEVAAQVGWFDPNLFARRFRLAYGMSPSEYRNRFGTKESAP